MGKILDMRRTMGSQEVLPKGIVPIEYLESFGNQFLYIREAITPATKQFELIIECSPTQMYNYNQIFGTTLDADTYEMWIYSSAQIRGRMYGYELFSKTTYVSLLDILTIDFSFDERNAKFQFVNNTTQETLNSKGTTSITSPLFFTIGKSGGDFSCLRFYSIKMKIDDEMIVDYTPVRIGQMGYMFDNVSHQLYSNDGIGDFILGPDKVGG